MMGTSVSVRLLVPGLTLILIAEVAVMAAWALGLGTSGFVWLVAALVASFSLSGSV
jgi:hypothetical protein